MYTKGKRCTGHIVRVEAFKADLYWTLDEANGKWSFWAGEPRSHYHLHCSEKGNHAGYGREDALKYYADNMPEVLLKAMENESASGEKP